MNQVQTQEYYRDSPSARWVALVVMCIGSFVAPLSLSSVLIATPSIANDLKADAIYVGWIPGAYLLTNVVTLLPIGRLADIWGRKRMYLLGCSVLVLASILASLATDMRWVLFCRLLQGLAGSMIFGCSLAILTAVFEGGRRGMAVGYMSAAVYMGLTCGPFIGGWLTESFGWRSVFMFPVPLLSICILLLMTKLKGEWRGQPGQRMDWTGALLFAGGTCSLFISASNEVSWLMLLGICLSLIFFVVFVHQQERSEYPLVRIRRLWQNRMFSRSLVSGVMMYGATFPLVFLLSLYLQYIQGMSAADAGKIMMLQAFMTALVAPFSGHLSDRYQTRVVASAGCFLVVMSFIPLQTLGSDTPIILIASAMIVFGIGFGLFAAPNNSAAMGSVAQERLGTASALLSLSRVAGNMLGTTMIVLLMAAYLGAEQIEPDQYPALMTVVRIALGCGLVFALLGSYFSLVRGNN